MGNLWLKVENIVAKVEIARFEQFLALALLAKGQKGLCRGDLSVVRACVRP